MTKKRHDVTLPELAKQTGYERHTLAHWCKNGILTGARRKNKGKKGAWMVSEYQRDCILAALKAGRAPYEGTYLPRGPKQKRETGQLGLKLGLATPAPAAVVDLTTHPELRRQTGLSKREKLAALALQGMLAGGAGHGLAANSSSAVVLEHVARVAVAAADKLLDELDSQSVPGYRREGPTT